MLSVRVCCTQHGNVVSCSLASVVGTLRLATAADSAHALLPARYVAQLHDCIPFSENNIVCTCPSHAAWASNALRVALYSAFLCSV